MTKSYATESYPCVQSGRCPTQMIDRLWTPIRWLCLIPPTVVCPLCWTTPPSSLLSTPAQMRKAWLLTALNVVAPSLLRDNSFSSRTIAFSSKPILVDGYSCSSLFLDVLVARPFPRRPLLPFQQDDRACSTQDITPSVSDGTLNLSPNTPPNTELLLPAHRIEAARSFPIDSPIALSLRLTLNYRSCLLHGLEPVALASTL